MIDNILKQPIHLGAANFLVGHFAPAVEDHGLDFVPFTQKLDDLILANLIIVLGGGWPELYFLELRALLMLALLVRFLIELYRNLP